MKLDDVLKDIKFRKDESLNPEISNVCCNSKEVKKNYIFACLKGVDFDGHDFAKQVSQDAAAILVERDLNLKNQVLVENSHEAYAKVCANFLGNPAKKLKIIGVTGTNGKTTVTSTIKNVLSMENLKTGLIGTIRNEIGEKSLKTDKTTPDHLEYQKILKQMADENCEYVSIEVSSHALNQNRTGDTEFFLAIFTNLTQDHLDYHGTMENYYEDKKKLFSRCKKAIICIDCEFGEKLAKEVKCETITFSCKNNKNANFNAKNIELQPNGVCFKLIGKNCATKINFKTPGMFSVQNAMAAAIACLNVGIPIEKIAKDLQKCPQIKGRSEIIETNENFTVICDYAHTPDGLENILTAIKTYCKGRIVTLFGCGGNRDKLKRPIMGKIAATYSDFLVITSDNPRTENKEKIINEISSGIKGIETPYVKMADRKKAIYYAIKNAKKNDVILLAGKGHETYQIIGNRKVDFDERLIVKEALSNLKN